MADMTTSTGGVETNELTSAYGAARELLDDAAAEATRRRSEAERYARQREKEAELLIQKARRLLYAAEEKAAVIVAMARAERDADRRVIDLDALQRADAPGAAAADGIPSRFDDLLASAISHAVADAFAESSDA